MMKPEERIARRFAKVVCHLGYDDKQYDFEPDKVTRDDIPKMLKWMKNLLETYYESGHCNEGMREDYPRAWTNHVRMIKTFIRSVGSEWKELEQDENAGWDKMSLKGHLYYWCFEYKGASKEDKAFYSRCIHYGFGRRKPDVTKAAAFLDECKMFLDKLEQQKGLAVCQQREDVKAVIVMLEAGTKGVYA